MTWLRANHGGGAIDSFLRKKCSSKNMASPASAFPLAGDGCTILDSPLTCNKKATMLMVMNDLMSLQLAKGFVNCILLSLNLDASDGCNSQKNNKQRPEIAYQYFNDEGDLNFEFHIDYCRSKDVVVVAEAATIDNKVATMSVRAPAQLKPIEFFGQDECLFAVSLPSQKLDWTKQGARLFPKSNSEGYMISAFVSRNSGFGLPVKEEQLARINAYRQGKQYIDKAAALEMYKSVEKQPLTESPFVRSLLIGASIGTVSTWPFNLKTPSSIV